MSDLRLLRISDVPQAMQLKDAAGWNQTEDDWRRVIELEPEGCFAVERDGRLISTASSICYGKELAWIGMVLTDPEFRGRGLASRLMHRILEFLNGRAVACVKLDATDLGRGVYRKLGFVDECPIERWVRAAGQADPVTLDSWELDAAMDLRAFGADRSLLLSSLAGESASIPGSGYAMGRAGSKAAYFGPCVAASPPAARRLAGWFLARHGGESVYWDLLPENREAVSLAEEWGFRRVRQLVRMTRGDSRRVQPDTRLVYAIAGFEFG